ncbi:MAG TPA: phospholipase D-like domain-containing protein [Fimbriimonadaceae bacterium]|nr:phospholipase D-like domain-containing protein [Fimbriimonadaceae bacterium]
MSFVNQDENAGFRCKLWRGERTCMLGFDVDQPEPDLVGFSIECKAPGDSNFHALRNRIAFSYPDKGVDGFRNFDSTQAPFQKFRWIHFPWNPVPGAYTYRATKIHMPQDGQLRQGTSITLDISLDPVTYANFLDVGFTRNFASSQAYADRFGNNPNVIPATAAQGLGFQKLNLQPDVYDWLGFEAKQLIFGILDEVVGNPQLSLDMLAYDFNEPDILARLENLGNRLRIVMDDSADHGDSTSAESQGAARLTAKGASVKRTHFRNLQHHKVLIVRRNGVAVKVLCGSTNFSFRGIYIQANNVIVFSDEDIAGLFDKVFEQAFNAPDTFSKNDLALKWHMPSMREPRVSFCFSPHDDVKLSLNPVGAAIDQATSSVFFSIAFLNQILSGPTREAIDRLEGRPIFSYGVVNQTGKKLQIHKPDGSVGLVDFAYLSAHAPSPFKEEWKAGGGINIHHKFVVSDFNLPGAKVFMGSSNLSKAGENNNGDNLVMIEDREVATSYAIEAVRLFDHLHFRSAMQEAASTTKGVMALKKPTAISGQPAWFERYYQTGTQLEQDRLIFSR